MIYEYKTLVFIPTLNDHELIDELIDEILLLGLHYSILIIDDGSTIPVKIKSINPRVFQYILPFNVGLGLVTNIALDFAFSHNFDSLIRIDSDGQHPIKFIPSVLEPILMKEADLVITHRINNFEINSVRNFFGSLLKRIINFASNITVGVQLNDWHSGCMAFSRYAIENLRMELFERYPEIEIIIYSHNINLKIKSCQILQNKRNHSTSSINLFQAIRHAIKIALLLLTFKINSLNK